MKIKEGFIIREIAGQTMAMPTADAFNGIIKLNSTATFLWKKLETETSREVLVESLVSEYDIDAQTATKCVDDFIAEMDKNGFLA